MSGGCFIISDRNTQTSVITQKILQTAQGVAKPTGQHGVPFLSAVVIWLQWRSRSSKECYATSLWQT